MDGILSWMVSALARFVIKTIADFTLIVQFRHHNEIGGAYWSMNIVINQIFCLISVYLYKERLIQVIAFNQKHNAIGEAVYADVGGESRCDTSDENGGGYIDDFVCKETTIESSLWNLVLGLIVFSMFNFGLFLLSIKREYWITFYDTRSGKQVVLDIYRSATTDGEKFAIFFNHSSFYKTEEEDLKKWLSENWEKWEEEKPDWFIAIHIACIPDDLLPVQAKRKLGGTKLERRKSIAAEIEVEAKAKLEKQKAGREGIAPPVS